LPLAEPVVVASGPGGDSGGLESDEVILAKLLLEASMPSMGVSLLRSAAGGRISSLGPISEFLRLEELSYIGEAAATTSLLRLLLLPSSSSVSRIAESENRSLTAYSGRARAVVAWSAAGMGGVDD
jgi:hypothetical protein